MRDIEIRRAPGRGRPVDDAGDPGICRPCGRHVEQHVAGLEVPVQESPFPGRCGTADDVDRRGPRRRVGAPRNHDGVRGRQRHVLAGPVGGAHRVDLHELAGQQRNARLHCLVVEDGPARQMGHQQRRVLALRGGRIDGDQSGGLHAGCRQQGQGVGLPVQRVLGAFHVVRVDEGAQHQVAGALVPRAHGQPPHVGGDAAAQRLGCDDPVVGPEMPVHPSQCRRADGRRLMMVGHRATPPSGREHLQRLSAPRRRHGAAGGRDGAAQRQGHRPHGRAAAASAGSRRSARRVRRPSSPGRSSRR